jgi:hypothetical protein
VLVIFQSTNKKKFLQQQLVLIQNKKQNHVCSLARGDDPNPETPCSKT